MPWSGLRRRGALATSTGTASRRTIGVAVAATMLALGGVSMAATSTSSTVVARTNAGGAAYVDSAGQQWAADSGFSGGWTFTTKNAIAGTTNQALYQSERAGMSGYAVPVPAAGTYRVTLHFAEVYWTAAGKRVFSVSAEGQPQVSNLDIFAAVGANKALTRTFDVPVSDGTLNLGFTATADTAKVSGIEVTPTTSSTTSTTTSPSPSPSASPSPSPSPTSSTSTPTSTSAPSVNAGTAVANKAWSLAFADEFNGTSLDLSRWSPMNGAKMNGVTTYASNVSVTGGNLVLTLASSTSGAFVSSAPSDGAGANGYLLPVGSYAEARVYFPGNGSAIYNWPAWWAAGPWGSGQCGPDAGEHDIAEGLGSLTVNYHSTRNCTNMGTVSGTWSNGFHVYGLYRGPGYADVYWDGQLVKHYTTYDNGGGESLLLNVGRGATDAFGAASQVKVDWVRAWSPK